MTSKSLAFAIILAVAAVLVITAVGEPTDPIFRPQFLLLY